MVAWVTDEQGREVLRIKGDLQDGATRQDAIQRIAGVTGKDPDQVGAALAMLAERVAPLSFWGIEAALGAGHLGPGRVVQDGIGALIREEGELSGVIC